MEALRAAQLAMLNKNRMEHGHALPATWGAFVLSGGESRDTLAIAANTVIRHGVPGLQGFAP